MTLYTIQVEGCVQVAACRLTDSDVSGDHTLFHHIIRHKLLYSKVDHLLVELANPGSICTDTGT